MRISKLIIKLQEFAKTNGDLEVRIEDETETGRTTSSISWVKEREKRTITGEEYTIAVIRS